MTERSDLKTWRFLLAAEAALQRAVEAAQAEQVNSLVTHQINEAGRSLGAALATLEDRVDSPASRTATFILELLDVDAMIAVLAGAIPRLPPATALRAQLTRLRDEFERRDVELRVAHDLPVD